MSGWSFERVPLIETKNFKKLIKELKKKRYSDGILWKIVFAGKDFFWELFWLFDVKASYFKYIYRKNILKTKPVEPDHNLEVHLLACGRDFLNAIWAIKSLSYFSNLQFKTVIHDDGTLSEIQKKTFSQHFKGGQIIETKDADREMKENLKNYKYLSIYRKKKKFYCSKKLLDPLFFSRTEQIILLDSDILFFNEPEEVLRHLKNKKSFYTSDIKSAYTHDIGQLKTITNINVQEKINAGLIYLNKTEYLASLSFLEAFFKKMDAMNFDGDINRLEQTAHAIILSKIKANRLSVNYRMSKEKLTNKAISYHFVNDGFRSRMYKVGLAKLKAENFLNKFNEKIN